jgi:signal transduction histidine kinase
MALNFLGLVYETGFFVKMDVKMAREYYNKALTLGSFDAKAKLYFLSSDVALIQSNPEIISLKNFAERLHTLFIHIRISINQLSKTYSTNENFKGYIETLKDAILFVNDLIKKSADFEKLELNTLQVDNESFDLHNHIQQVLNLMQHKAKPKNNSLKADISSSIPKIVSGDEVKLRQVLLNLIGNALKFTNNGEVTLNVYTKIDDSDGFRIFFEVHDTGEGMTDDELEKIFIPYEQANENIYIQYGGTGLGLPYAKKLIKLMGGTISVKSKKGKVRNLLFLYYLINRN